MTITLDELNIISQEVGEIFNKHKLSLFDGLIVLTRLKESAMCEALDGLTEIK